MVYDIGLQIHNFTSCDIQPDQVTLALLNVSITPCHIIPYILQRKVKMVTVKGRSSVKRD